MEHVLTALDNISNISNSFRNIFSSQQWINFQSNQPGNQSLVPECLTKLELLSNLSTDLESLEKQFMSSVDPTYENLPTPYSFCWDKSSDKKPDACFLFEMNLDQQEHRSDSDFEYNHDKVEDNTSYMEEDQSNNIQQTSQDRTSDTDINNYYSQLDENKKKLFSSYDEILILQNYENKQMRQNLYQRLKQKNYQINAHYHSLQRQMKKNSLNLSQFLEMKQNNLRIKRNQHQNIFSAEEQIKIIEMYADKEKRKELFKGLSHSQKSIKIKYNNILKEMRKNSLSVSDYIRVKQEYLTSGQNIKEEDASNDYSDDLMKVQKKAIRKSN